MSDQKRNFRSDFELGFLRLDPSIRDGVHRSGTCILREFKIFFHPAKFDFKDEKISDFITVSVSQRKNVLN